jgi:RNA polymerase sigma factor (sigma-70 family)
VGSTRPKRATLRPRKGHRGGNDDWSPETGAISNAGESLRPLDARQNTAQQRLQDSGFTTSVMKLVKKCLLVRTGGSNRLAARSKKQKTTPLECEEMATSQLNEVIEYLATMVRQDDAEMSDGELLNDFVSRKDEAALAVLVRRHGPMVWGVCRRLLRCPHDAEDAFQATFLVLVRKAAAIRDKELVGNWLYGVAHQTAVRVRTMVAKRGARERQVGEMPEPAAPRKDSQDDLVLLLDQELRRLPVRYRAFIVLCDLEGKTRKEVAQLLGCPEGTVGSRLARARQMLAKRLSRQGLAVSGGALPVVVSQVQALASAPAALVASTIQAGSLLSAGQAVAASLLSAKVIALAERVVNNMLLTKIKRVMVLLLLAGLLLGGVVFGVALAQGKNRSTGTPARVPLRLSPSDLFAGELKRLEPHFGLAASGCFKLDRTVKGLPEGTTLPRQPVQVHLQLWENGKARSVSSMTPTLSERAELSISVREVPHMKEGVRYRVTTSLGSRGGNSFTTEDVPLPKRKNELESRFMTVRKLDQALEIKDRRPITLWVLACEKGGSKIEANESLEQLAKRVEWALVLSIGVVEKK